MKKIMYAVLTIAIVGVVYVGWDLLTFDKQAESFTQSYIERQLRAENYTNLRKISKDNYTYRYLKKSKNVKVTFSTDNQGGGPVAYYPAKINYPNGRNPNCGVRLKVKSVIPSRFSVIDIFRFK